MDKPLLALITQATMPNPDDRFTHPSEFFQALLFASGYDVQSFRTHDFEGLAADAESHDVAIEISEGSMPQPVQEPLAASDAVVAAGPVETLSPRRSPSRWVWLSCVAVALGLGWWALGDERPPELPANPLPVTDKTNHAALTGPKSVVPPDAASAKRTPEETKKPRQLAPDKCPRGMVRIDEGTVYLGTRSTDPMRSFGDLSMERRRYSAFCIDRYEFPNRRGVMPTTGVTWYQARNRCRNRGKRLCRESEWARACKGPGNYRFPVGQKMAGETCNFSEDLTRPRQALLTGQKRGCRTAEGVMDMAGNVAEWTASPWSLEVSDYVVRGGAARDSKGNVRCGSRLNEVASTRNASIGFRCCRGLK